MRQRQLPKPRLASCSTAVEQTSPAQNCAASQERRKAEEQEAAEAEAAAKAKAGQLREKARQANLKAVAKMEKLRSEGRASREAANAAVLDAVRYQASTVFQHDQGSP